MSYVVNRQTYGRTDTQSDRKTPWRGLIKPKVIRPHKVDSFFDEQHAFFIRTQFVLRKTIAAFSPLSNWSPKPQNIGLGTKITLPVPTMKEVKRILMMPWPS